MDDVYVKTSLKPFHSSAVLCLILQYIRDCVVDLWVLMSTPVSQKRQTGSPQGISSVIILQFLRGSEGI